MTSRFPHIQDFEFDTEWVSTSGLGTANDKSQGAHGKRRCLGDYELLELYESSGLVQAAIGRLVDDGIRRGYKIALQEDEDAAQELNRQWRELDHEWGLTREVSQHLIQSALFGGGIILQVQDDADQSEPYVARPLTLPRFLALSPLDVHAAEVEMDAMSPNYRKALSWSVERSTSGFNLDHTWGHQTTMDRIYSGDMEWRGKSLLESFYTELRQHGISMQAAVHMLQTLNQTIYKLDNAVAAAGAGEKARAAIRKRIAKVQSAASNFNPVVMDMSESVETLTQSTGGVDQILNWTMVSLCASAKIPATILFGVSPSGFGTGESEMELWRQRVESFRQHKTSAALKFIVSRLMETGHLPMHEKFDIEFESLDSPTELETASLRKLVADTDALYVSMGVLDPTEIAQSRFGDAWSMETHIDMELRENMDEPPTPEDEAALNPPQEEEDGTPTAE